MTLAIAIVGGALISGGFFWLLWRDLPRILRQAAERRKNR